MPSTLINHVPYVTEFNYTLLADHPCYPFLHPTSNKTREYFRKRTKRNLFSEGFVSGLARGINWPPLKAELSNSHNPSPSKMLTPIIIIRGGLPVLVNMQIYVDPDGLLKCRQ